MFNQLPAQFNAQLKQQKLPYLIVGLLLTFYIVFNVQTPKMLAASIDSVYGTLLIVAVVVLIAFQGHPILAVLAAIAAYFLIKRSSVSSGAYALQHYLPSERVKVMDYAKYNNFPYSLEEEVVAHMAPLVKYDAPMSVDYKPVLDAQFDAAPVDYDGVV